MTLLLAAQSIMRSMCFLCTKKSTDNRNAIPALDRLPAPSSPDLSPNREPASTRRSHDLLRHLPAPLWDPHTGRDQVSSPPDRENPGSEEQGHLEGGTELGLRHHVPHPKALLSPRHTVPQAVRQEGMSLRLPSWVPGANCLSRLSEASHQPSPSCSEPPAPQQPVSKAHLVTWVRVLKSRERMERRTSMQPMY